MGLTPNGVFGSEDQFNKYHELIHNYRVAIEWHTRSTVVK